MLALFATSRLSEHFYAGSVSGLAVDLSPSRCTAAHKPALL